MTDKNQTEWTVATFGGGCFWCIEAVFSRLNGVKSATSGFAGGHLEHPTYEQVVAGNTGHAEVVQITYDPSAISYLQLLEVFFKVHDPTTLNRQGNDIGPQYRSVIFFHNEEQKNKAEQAIAALSREGIWDDPIVTELSPLDAFYAASDYHQNYFARNPYQAYCQMVISPKVKKFEQLFRDLLKE
ncbi:MAG: peptide-methionine (S)-S-oxide reductase MsrA [Bacteroidales bacterium]|nr:peptide-methionine (S)-S-oxide reductase MsrA [Bacteroidales bacterium]